MECAVYFCPVLNRFLVLLLAILVASELFGQAEVTIHGTIRTTDVEHAFYDLMIVNRRTRNGSFGNEDGTFTVRALRTDTLLIGAGGYLTRAFTLSDTAASDTFELPRRV